MLQAGDEVLTERIRARQESRRSAYGTRKELLNVVRGFERVPPRCDAVPIDRSSLRLGNLVLATADADTAAEGGRLPEL